MGNRLFFTCFHYIFQMLTLQVTIRYMFRLRPTNFVRQSMYMKTKRVPDPPFGRSASSGWCKWKVVQPVVRRHPTNSCILFSFQSLASVTHGHGTQALHWRCAKQKDRVKIFHCSMLEKKALSRSAPPTAAVPSLYTWDPQEFFGGPRRCGCLAIRGRSARRV